MHNLKLISVSSYSTIQRILQDEDINATVKEFSCTNSSPYGDGRNVKKIGGQEEKVNFLDRVAIIPGIIQEVEKPTINNIFAFLKDGGTRDQLVTQFGARVVQFPIDKLVKEVHLYKFGVQKKAFMAKARRWFEDSAYPWQRKVFKRRFFSMSRNTRSKPMTSLSMNFSNMAAVKERCSFCSTMNV